MCTCVYICVYIHNYIHTQLYITSFQSILGDDPILSPHLSPSALKKICESLSCLSPLPVDFRPRSVARAPLCFSLRSKIIYGNAPTNILRFSCVGCSGGTFRRINSHLCSHEGEHPGNRTSGEKKKKNNLEVHTGQIRASCPFLSVMLTAFSKLPPAANTAHAKLIQVIKNSSFQS